ncbi:MAG TPA: AAA family ATPase, partial [Thermoanaerobaculia bacterium]|nr:AAA family ATPase [Thermoanaerobaculia bacterium]
EVDAATYSKVEQVRDLTESLRYGPARDRYKVVVLDEIHRLSRQAFDALLKIVEEPPPHLVFIFATTEIDAVPATILSRCQEFHFRRVPSPELAAHLRRISEAEGIAASDTALRLVARAGEGSVRDSVALLDQLATFGSGTIPDEEAIRLLGGLDTALFHRLLAAILQGDGLGVSAAVHRVEDEGWDPRHVYSQFLAFCRDALHLAMGGDPGQIDLPGEEAASLAALAQGSGYENLLRLLHQLLTSEPIVRRSETGALAVEIAWLRAAELPKLIRVEELLAGGAPRAAAPAPARTPNVGAGLAPAREGVNPSPTSRTPVPARSTPPEPAEEPRKAAPPPAPAPAVAAAPPADPPAAAASPDNGARPQPAPAPPRPAAAIQGGVQTFLQEVERRKPHLAGYLNDADLSFADGGLSIGIPPGDRILKARLENESNRQVIDAALAAAWGPGASWRAVMGEARPAGAAAAETAPPQEEHPIVQTVLDIFKGRVVETVEEGSLREE